FAPLAGKFSHWNLAKLRSAKRIEYDVRANWKLMFENYSECYHCPGVHPMLSKVSPYDSAENDLAKGPFLGGFMSINKGRSLTMSGDACAFPVKEEEEEGEEEKQRVFYYSIFPNMLLSMHPEYVMVHQLWPQSPERTLIVCDWFFHPDAFARKDFKPEDAIEFWDMTNKQDWHVCELSQQGIASRAYQPGPLPSRAPSEEQMKQVKVSVIVPAYNARATITDCLGALEDQSLRDECEIIVVDSSTDDTAAVVAEMFPEVRLFTFPERRFPSSARNFAVSQARGEIIAFTDADCVVAPGWLGEIIGAHRSDLPVIGGAIDNGSPESYIGWVYYFCEFNQ